ncbi:MAG TPA: hypothetical protein VNW54_10000 [Granulicella sp.]|jgi:hypothetical protein|nr:hypothetical protein [Granulicella sp.]
MIHESILAVVAGVTTICALAAYYAWIAGRNQFFFFGRTLPADFAETASTQAISRAFRLCLARLHPQLRQPLLLARRPDHRSLLRLHPRQPATSLTRRSHSTGLST